MAHYSIALQYNGIVQFRTNGNRVWLIYIGKILDFGIVEKNLGEVVLK